MPPQALTAGRDTTLAALESPINASEVFLAAAAGDPVAGEIAAEAGRHLAWAVHLLVMTYDVEVVALGGGVAGAGDAFLDPILRSLDALRDASELAREVLRPGVVHLLPAGADAGAWGAVALARAAATGDRPSSVARREVGDA